MGGKLTFTRSQKEDQTLTKILPHITFITDCTEHWKFMCLFSFWIINLMFSKPVRDVHSLAWLSFTNSYEFMLSWSFPMKM